MCWILSVTGIFCCSKNTRLLVFGIQCCTPGLAQQGVFLSGAPLPPLQGETRQQGGASCGLDVLSTVWIDYELTGSKWCHQFLFPNKPLGVFFFLFFFVKSSLLLFMVNVWCPKWDRRIVGYWGQEDLIDKAWRLAYSVLKKMKNREHF